ARRTHPSRHRKPLDPHHQLKNTAYPGTYPVTRWDDMNGYTKAKTDVILAIKARARRARGQ
ncbi:hypothetical protein, partial [Actinoplanes sp. NPDC051411]|uniref:hypothetical protein n=1 Tax=Actinoplanes sp. NPDC051411 TaxID=3155522 RepID=UPI003447022B